MQRLIVWKCIPSRDSHFGLLCTDDPMYLEAQESSGGQDCLPEDEDLVREDFQDRIGLGFF